MENKYVNGKIYKIVDNTNGNIYVGSTIEKLKERLRKHKVKYKLYLQGKPTYTSSFKILENNDYHIELLEDYPCNSKKELETKEREHIENIVCVNKIIPTRTKKEWEEENKEKIKEERKKYYEENKEKLKEGQKKYRENNLEKIKEGQKKHYEENKEKILEERKKYQEENKEKIKIKEKKYREENKEKIKNRKKKYYEENKEQIKKRTSEKITCEGGAIINKNDLARHKKSLKHIKFTECVIIDTPCS